MYQLNYYEIPQNKKHALRSSKNEAGLNSPFRLQAHNHGQSPHTSKYKPWILITYLSFNDKARAISFEKYLKSHSGKAFANKRFW